MVCLDSDILINYLRREQRAINLFKKSQEEGKQLCTTSINSFELIKGIPRSSKVDKQKVLDFLSNFKIYEFDFEVSRIAAEIFENLKSNGQMIDLTDIMIASTVIKNGETLATLNLSHFNRINNLQIENNFT